MEIGVLISIAAVLISFISLMMNGRKDTRADASSNAVTQTKLDNLIAGVTEIRVEIRSLQQSINDHTERLAKVEARAESNTHRLDTMEGKSQ